MTYSENIDTTKNQALDEANTNTINGQPDTTAKTVAEEIIYLLEERLVVENYVRKIGEVVVRKEIETHIIEVPVRSEKIIVEQTSPEYKQLASIDLRTEQVPYPNQDLASYPFPQEKYTSAEIARQFLETIATASKEKHKVKLVFEDATLQLAYQQWLEKNL